MVNAHPFAIFAHRINDIASIASRPNDGTGRIRSQRGSRARSRMLIVGRFLSSAGDAVARSFAPGINTSDLANELHRAGDALINARDWAEVADRESVAVELARLRVFALIGAQSELAGVVADLEARGEMLASWHLRSASADLASAVASCERLAVILAEDDAERAADGDGPSPCARASAVLPPLGSRYCGCDACDSED